MEHLPLRLKEKAVQSYLSGHGSYEQVAEMFGIGRATLSRALRQYREQGEVSNKPKGGNRPRAVDEQWLRRDAQSHPDARLIDRVDSWEKHSGQRVHISTMALSMRRIGWTHKKRLR